MWESIYPLWQSNFKSESLIPKNRRDDNKVWRGAFEVRLASVVVDFWEKGFEKQFEVCIEYVEVT